MGAAPTSDPYAYMEEAEGAKALAFARAENARSLPQLQNDPRYAGLYADALKIATAKDRIPGVAIAGDGTLRDFWQDADHVRGVWRTTTLESYRTAAPEWKTLLDVDALAKAEGKNWVFKGAQCLKPADRYCLISLSNGGKDAVETREFDAQAGKFVAGGFSLPEAKSNVAWIDKDTLAVATEWTPGDLTQSSYPYILKTLKRGEPLSDAQEVFRGRKTDVSTSPVVLNEPDGTVAALLAQRGLDFFNNEIQLITPQGPRKVELPTKSTIQAYVDGQLVVTLEQDWPQKGFREGDLVAFDLAAVKADPADLKGTLVLRPTASQAIDQVANTRHRLAVVLYDNVRGKLITFRHAAGGWAQATAELPKDSTITVSSASDADDRMIVGVTSFLTPSSQWLADSASGKTQMLKATPARFDASKDTVDQFWAISRDGTKVPYWVVRPKTLKLDGQAPTLLTAYGGFQVSETPAYAAMAGKLWLEKGGVYVLANIRGGGEFGPRWHNAGLKLNRMRVYEDFFAVSRDLIARKITNPKKLGIEGGSNGGLLMGVALTQHPELYNAIVIQVPLFDMIGYTHIGAGASWVGEYGDPAVPAERAVLETYSPYQLLKPSQPYPKVFIETSTKDDRVHPAHARKAAARLKEYGYDYLYYENIDGGH
ncbi:MAG: prolyl oligopeptidase family protein, partial [Caulobacterales bacterium]